MLDMGFEREMTECMEEIKKRCVGTSKFTQEAGKFWSDEIKVQFVSATLSSKVEALGADLMQNYEIVGFNDPSPSKQPDSNVEQKEDDEELSKSIPKQV